MASKPTYEEVLRYVIEATGEKDIAAIARQILNLSDASDEAKETTARLLDGFADAQGLERSAKAFRALGTEITEVQGRYTSIQARITALTTDMAKVEEPTRRQEKELANLTRQLSEAGGELLSLRTKWQEQRETLEAAGVSTQRYGAIAGQVEAIQRRLALGIQDHAQSLLKAQQAQERVADFSGRLTKQLDEQGRTTLDTANDLKTYGRAADTAGKQTRELAQHAQTSTSIFEKLRAAAGAVFAFFTVDKLVGGLKAVVTEGSKGEQELAQLEAALASTGRQAEFTAEQLDAMAEGISRGLFDKGDITNAQTRLLTYTNIVGEMFPRALQISIDQAQRLGISVESSSELIGRALQTPSKAMEALSKQGFVLEASQKQLIKELEATGKTAQAQAVIMDLLVESYGGAAAAAQTNTILGLWERLRETWRDWQQDVANRGVLNYFKDQIRQILDTTARLAEDGTLGRWAQQTADAIVRLSEFLKSATRTLFEHRDAIVFAAKAYAAFKIGAAILQMNQWRIALMASTREALANAAAVRGVGASTTQLGTILRALPTSLKIGVALVGIELAMRYAADLGEWLAKNSAAAERLAEVQRQVSKEMEAAAAGYAAGARGLEQYAHQTSLTSEQVLALSEAERTGYAERLEGLRRYLVQLSLYYTAMKEAGALTPEMARDWEVVQQRLGAVHQALQDVATVSDAVARGLERGIPAAAQLLVDKLEGIANSSKLAKSEIQKLFEDLDFTDDGALGNVALALAEIGAEGDEAGKNVRAGLLEALRQLSGEELLRLQSAGHAAFEEYKIGAADAASVLDTTLYVALEKLGVSASRSGFAMTEMGKDAIASFATVLESATSTGMQIENALRGALERVATIEEAQALGAQLKAAGEQGKLGFDQTARSLQLVEQRIRQLKTAVDPLAADFEKLGISSQAALDAAAAEAKTAFEAIRRAFALGKASIEDVRRAYEAYARTQRDAVAESDSSAKVRVEGELQVLKAIYDVNDGLNEMTRAGADAGSAVAAGANEAASALEQVGSSGQSASSATKKVGEAAWSGREGLYGAAQGAYSLAQGFGELSQAALDAYMATNKTISPLTSPGNDIFPMFQGINNVTDRIREQKEALDEELRSLEKTASGYDDLEERRVQLQQKYGLLGKSQAEQVLQLEQQNEQKRKARLAEEERERAAQREADLERLNVADKLQQAAGGARIPVSDGKLTVVLEYPEPASGGELSPQERRAADRIMSYILPRITRELARSKSITVSQRPRPR